MTTKRATKKIGQRTFTLKELAQRDFVVIPQEQEEEIYPRFNLVNIQEDLLDDVLKPRILSNNGSAKIEGMLNNIAPSNQDNLALPIHLINQLIQKEIARAANAINLEEFELQAWIDLQVMAPKKTLLALLRIAVEHQLDPLKEEIVLTSYDDSEWQAYITIEGYSKILNTHPAFDGIAFTQAQTNTNEIPIWMECTIYRKDRSHPIIVREYFEEVKGDQSIWQRMPRRMLRHRVMQQCARLAIGC